MFRLDINAMRFLAVLGVVLFHFKVPFFNGGYAGVDIFFVISGYLMYEIMSKKEINLITIKDFYRKRISRIYPALLGTVVISSLLMITFTPPSYVSEILKETISSLLFLSNLYFYKSLNYFSGSSDSFFLLHTWSLSLEVQYYLIFPIVLYAINKIKINKSLILLILTLFSFAIMIYFGKNSPQAAFYLLPFRAWEFFLGALAASLVFIDNPFKKTTEYLSIFTILIFFIFCKETSAWPNFLTIIPTLATAFLLHAKVENNRVLLKNNLIQYIGKWSYSIYLVHWPIVSILFLNSIPFSAKNQLIFVALSIFLGFLSYTLIEQKIPFNFKKIATVSLMTIFAVYLADKYAITKNWTDKDILQLDNYLTYAGTKNNTLQFSGNIDTCFLTSKKSDLKYFNKDECLKFDKSKKNLLLLGDSHAAQFSQAIREKFKNYNVIQITASGCPAIPNTVGRPYCKELMNYAFNKIIPKYNFDIAIVSNDWSIFYTSNKITKGIEETDAILRKNSKDVYFISQTKHFDLPLPRLLQIYGVDSNINYLRDLKTEQVYLDMKNKLRNKVNILDIYNIECKKNTCHFINEHKVPMFFDNNHLTYDWTKSLINSHFPKSYY